MCDNEKNTSKILCLSSQISSSHILREIDFSVLIVGRSISVFKLTWYSLLKNKLSELTCEYLKRTSPQLQMKNKGFEMDPSSFHGAGTCTAF